MRAYSVFSALLLCVSAISALGQQFTASAIPTGSISGTVTDVADGVIPGAAVVIDGPSSNDHHTATADDVGSFAVRGLQPSVPYHVTVKANGFAEWDSSEVVLAAGQALQLPDIRMKISVVTTTVAAVTIEQLATEQVHAAEQQRVLGVIPNFYVVYDNNPAPLTTKLKFQLAMRAAVDPVTIAGVGILSAANQAGNTPDFQQGAKGYGQRFGAAAADGFSDILIGGAVLPSLLHQDPRYFYQGTGSTKSRMIHAMSAPFIARGDNGRWQFNYSSVGGDLASGALSNLYYPESNRGPGLVFTGFAVTTGGRIVKAMAEEFILPKFTSRAKHKEY